MENQETTISLLPEKLFTIGDTVIVNSLFTFMVTVLILAVVGLVVSRNFKRIPGRFQVIMEGILLVFYDKLKISCPSEKYFNRILYVVTTIFLVVLCSNFFSYIPLLHAVKYGEASLFRTATAHFSLPIAISVVVVLGSNLAAFLIAPFKYTGNFIRIMSVLKARSVTQFLNGLLDIFLGLMDIVGEMSKFISLSARLFGNMLSGELISIIILMLAPYGAPIPFYLLGIMSALIQALVVSLLSMQYINGMIGSVLGSGHSSEEKSNDKKVPVNA